MFKFQKQLPIADPSTIFRRNLAQTGLKIGILCFFGLALALLLMFDISTQAKQLNELRKERKWILDSLDATAKLITDRPRANELIFLLKKGLPTSFDAATIVMPTIRELANQSGVRASSEVKGEKPASGTEPRSVEIVIRADGSQINLAEFVKAIEAHDLAFKFSGLNIIQSEGETAAQLQLAGQVYVASPELEAELVSETEQQPPASEAATAPAAQEILPENVSINLLNGSGIIGLAKAWQNKLAAAGFTDITIGNADTTDYTGVSILSKPSKQQILPKIREVFSALKIDIRSEEAQAEETEYDIVIILGK